MPNKKPIKNISTKKHVAREHREARQTRIILIIAIAFGVIVLGLIGYGVIDQAVIRPRTPVAQVGDEVITAREFESYVQYTRVQMLNQSFQYYTFHQQFGEFGGNFLQTAQTIAMQLAQPISLGREVLDEMIGNLIVKEEAAKRGITVSQEEIDQAIQSAFGFFPAGTLTPTVTATILPTPTYSEAQLELINTPTATVDESLLEESGTPAEDNFTAPEATQAENIEPVLEETDAIDSEPEIATTPEATPTITLTPTPYTTAMFAQNIKDFNAMYRMYNFDINDLRDIFEIQLLREKLAESLTEDLEPFKDEVWARHILVETNEQALEVISRLDEGEDFFTLAAAYSLDESNKDRGGDLGWFDENTMVSEFTDVAFTLAEGEISEPVESTFGFHIIQVLGKRVSQIPPAAFAQQRQIVFTEWLNEQRETREDIEIFDGWENFVPTTPEVPQQFLAELYQQQ